MPTSPPRNLTELLSKVLDQLSLSSWLPSLTFVGGVTFTAELAQLRRPSPLDALAAIGAYPLGGFVLLAVAVVLTALLTQAFAFQTIRLIEGYWGTDPISAWLAQAAISVETRRRARIRRRLRETEDRARSEAVAAFRDAETRPTVNSGIDQGADSDDHLTDLIEMMGDDWMRMARPATLRRLEQLKQQEQGFPALHRILPTRLGNTLRSYEDRLETGDGDLEGYVLRHFDELPEPIRSEHDQHRARLDLYCTLEPTFVVLAAVSIGTLAGRTAEFRVAGLVIGTVELALATLCYHSAIASAHAYGTVLLAIDELIARELDLTELPEDGNPPEADDEVAVLPPTPGAGGAAAIAQSDVIEVFDTLERATPTRPS